MLQAYGLDVPRTLEEICDPKRMALLVYDMQVGVLRQIKNGAAITESVIRVLHAARDAGIRVDLLSPHVAAKGTHGCVPAPNGDGLAARGNGRTD